MFPSPTLVEATFGALLVPRVHSKGRSCFSKSKEWRLLACCPKPIPNMAQETTNKKEQCSGPSKAIASAAPLAARPSCTPWISMSRHIFTCFHSLLVLLLLTLHDIVPVCALSPMHGFACLLHVVNTTICNFFLPLLFRFFTPSLFRFFAPSKCPSHIIFFSVGWLPCSLVVFS